MNAMNQAFDLLEKAFVKLKEGAIQSHYGHFDRTGNHGAGCPECIRARHVYNAAMEMYEQAVELNRKMEES